MIPFKPYTYLQKIEDATGEILGYELHYSFELPADHYVVNRKFVPCVHGTKTDILLYEYEKNPGGNDIFPRLGKFTMNQCLPADFRKIETYVAKKGSGPIGGDGKSTHHYEEAD